MLKFLKKGVQTLQNALIKTRDRLSARLRALWGKPWDDATFEELEQILYEADLGSSCAADLVDHLRSACRTRPIQQASEVLDLLRAHATKILEAPPRVPPTSIITSGPQVILIVGVNGSGKTTSIAKLAHRFQQEGKKVLLAAGDTFRAAAIEQLDLWAKRLSIELIKSQMGGDPSAVAYDALSAAIARGVDIVLIDTAGRLQNKTDLMRELEKITRVCKKVIPDAPHETWLILDATTGQNAIDQTQAFHHSTPLTGLVMTKLDGSAKGGILLAIYERFGIPIRWVGTGEQQDDIEPFDVAAYIDGLF